MKNPPIDPAAAAELERLELVIRQARARRSQFLRELSGKNRKLETQRLCLLGRAVGVFVDREPGFEGAFTQFLVSYIDRDTDKMALAGTRFDVVRHDKNNAVAVD